NLGVMYVNGTGVIKDNVYAHLWWNITASFGDKDASENRDIIAEQMTLVQLKKAKNLAHECVRKKFKGC
ncbi:MAG: SEL1-like repeat protein, partial [Arenicellales bacterium]|nr:SEL1-like repeat protein [Arenicellales bacterium]